MSSKELQEALAGIPVDAVGKKVAERKQKIGAAPATMPKGDYNTNLTAHILHPAEQHLVIKEVVDQPDAKYFRLRADAGKPLAPFTAGQYVSVYLNIEGSTLTRPYALCSSPADVAKGEYAIAVKKVKDGFASDYILNHWKTGDSVTVSGPEGNLYYEPMRDAANVVGLAGGSGITPFLSMAEAIRDGAEDFSLTLLYGCNRESEILFKNELDRIAAECPKFKVVYVLSEEDKTAEGFEHGFLTAELVAKYAPAEYSLFVCGPPAMYRFLTKEIDKMNVPKRRVRFEAAGEYKNPEEDTGYPAEAKGKTFKVTVDLPTGRRSISAKAGESLLTSLEREGIRVPSRCRSGECGFCRTRLKSGTVYIPPTAEHRRKADAKDGFIHPCCTFPTSDLHLMVNCDNGEVIRKVKDMKKKERKVGIIMAIVISVVMGALFTFISRNNVNEQALKNMPPAAVAYILGILESVTVGVIIALVIPIQKWGRGLAAKCNAYPPSMKFTLLNSIPFALINSILISAVCSFIGVATSYSKIGDPNKPPLMAMWFSNWISTLWIGILVSYILAVLISPFVVQAVGLGGPPTGGDQPRD